MYKYKRCEQCRRGFVASRSTARFCSAKCRVYRSRGITPTRVGRERVKVTQTDFVKAWLDELKYMDSRLSDLYREARKSQDAVPHDGDAFMGPAIHAKIAPEAARFMADRVDGLIKRAQAFQADLLAESKLPAKTSPRRGF